jgi:serine/threonine protein kinase
MLPADSYLIEAFVGQGGMGAVYKGLQMPLRRPVAIKVLRKGTRDEFEYEERFRREAYAMATLTHPHIVQVHDCGDAGEDHLFISMEFVDGGDLAGLLKRGEMTPARALELGVQICEALQFAHANGIVHRDIKPANILLTKDGRVKVADFGLAKRFNAQSSFMTQTGVGMGTPEYAAPEQFLGAKDLDHRADIYSFGVLLYQMITGVLPRGGYRPPSQRVAVDERLDSIVYRAMEHERDDRYQSADEIKEELVAVMGAATKTACAPGRSPRRASCLAAAGPFPRRSVPRPPRSLVSPRSEPPFPREPSSPASACWEWWELERGGFVSRDRTRKAPCGS